LIRFLQSLITNRLVFVDDAVRDPFLLKKGRSSSRIVLYFDGQTEIVTAILSAETRRFSVQFLRPLWIGLAATLLIVVALALFVVLPAHRRQVAIREVAAAGGGISFQDDTPQFLRSLLGDKWIRSFDTVDHVHFSADPDTVHRRFKGFWNGPLPMTSRPTNIDVSTLRQIGQLTSLKSLDLSYTDAGADGIEELGRLSRLAELDLSGTNVSDSHVASLARFRSLKVLLIKDSNVTREGYLQLRKALPGCQIYGGASQGYGDPSSPGYTFPMDAVVDDALETRPK